MRIAQLVLPGASAYERKSQQLDAAALGGQAESLSYTYTDTGVRQPLRLSAFDLVHVYGPRELPPATFVGFPKPYVASGTVRKPRFSFRSPREPEYALSPVESDDYTLLPEAVDDAYFDGNRQSTGNLVIGSIQRASTTNIIDQTLARIHRFRTKTPGHLSRTHPTPADPTKPMRGTPPRSNRNDSTD